MDAITDLFGVLHTASVGYKPNLGGAPQHCLVLRCFRRGLHTSILITRSRTLAIPLRDGTPRVNRAFFSISSLHNNSPTHPSTLLNVYPHLTSPRAPALQPLQPPPQSLPPSTPFPTLLSPSHNRSDRTPSLKPPFLTNQHPITLLPTISP